MYRGHGPVCIYLTYIFIHYHATQIEHNEIFNGYRKMNNIRVFVKTWWARDFKRNNFTLWTMDNNLLIYVWMSIFETKQHPVPKKGPKWIHSNSLQSIPFSDIVLVRCLDTRYPHPHHHQSIRPSASPSRLIIIIGFTLFIVCVWIDITHQNREGDIDVTYWLRVLHISF